MYVIMIELEIKSYIINAKNVWILNKPLIESKSIVMKYEYLILRIFY